MIKDLIGVGNAFSRVAAQWRPRGALLAGVFVLIQPSAATSAEPKGEPPVLRTPDDRFENLPGFAFEPNYVEVNGMRMHYVDEGRGEVILCLHGEPSWCYLYRKMIPPLAEKYRVVAPDLIGFGRSDKPADRSAYTFAMHYAALEALIDQLDLKQVTMVGQDWGGILGLVLAAERPDRFARLVLMNTGLPTGEGTASPAFLAWRAASQRSDDMPIGRVIQRATSTQLSDEVLAAYDAPFPDKSYKAGALEFPLLVPIRPDDPAAAPIRKAREALRQWTRPTLVLFSDGDPITAGGDRGLRKLIPAARDEPEAVIRKAGHFLQEDRGEEIARHILEFLGRRPLPDPAG